MRKKRIRGGRDRPAAPPGVNADSDDEERFRLLQRHDRNNDDDDDDDEARHDNGEILSIAVSVIIFSQSVGLIS